ncbi:MAG: response regulator transcription factor [Gaiellaceae bacterium]
MSAAVLLAEAEKTSRDELEQSLAGDGYSVVAAAGGGEALELLEREQPDLVLLGAELPDLPALELCRRLRSGMAGPSWNRDLPLILVGADHADPLERVRAFAGGCDDVLARPFHYEELRARIEALLRRVAPRPQRIAVRDLEIDISARRVCVLGERVMLSVKEFELLVKLASEPARVFGREELLREVWGYVSLGCTRTVDSHASRLRRKLSRPGAERYVVNEWGVGYRLVESWPD